MRGWLAMSIACASACGRGPIALRDEPAERVDCDQADFLFVIDDSPSMKRYQDELVARVPEFVDGVQRAVEYGTDLHVGVVTTDAYLGNPPPCNVLGGLVTQTSGPNSSHGTCGPYADGANYMTESDDLAEAFSCAAEVGTIGDSEEQPLGALVDALSPESAAAECNEGFLRDDALLVAVVVTDESDGSSPEWMAREVIDAKHGQEESIVVVSLIDHDTLCEQAGTEGYDWTLAQFTNQFEHGFVGPICRDYRPVFERAVDIVADVCAGE